MSGSLFPVVGGAGTNDDLDRWLHDETVDVPVQIRGKLPGRIVVPAGADAAALEAAARTDPRITELLAGRRIVKVIAVPGRLVNFVVEG